MRRFISAVVAVGALNIVINPTGAVASAHSGGHLSAYGHFGTASTGLAIRDAMWSKTVARPSGDGASTTTHIITRIPFFLPMLPKDANRNSVRYSLGERLGVPLIQTASKLQVSSATSK